MTRSKVTISSLLEKKKSGEKITVLTAYDFSMAALVDQAGVDVILVGDSLGMVVLGYDSTAPVTMDEMIHHCRAVRRGTRNAFLLGDMPFMSYNISKQDAIRNAGRFIKEAGCDGVKIEGGAEMADTVKAIVDAGIPVCAHIGLTPQTATKLSGFKVQGKDAESARILMNSARALDEAGAFLIVFECIPDMIAAEITNSIGIPTIGIGAGPGCDGQVLVINDMLGLFERFIPKFVRQYANLAEQVKEGLSRYVTDVKSGVFPGPEHCFTMSRSELEKLELK